MFASPYWLWGCLGGLALGPIGLLILLPGCSRGAQSLLKRFVISFIVKLILAGVAIVLAVKRFHLPPLPLMSGFLIGYFISLFVEIIPCIWKVRQCTRKPSQTQ